MHYVRHRNQWWAEGLTSEAFGQAYALRLPAGSRDVVMHFRPRLLGEGLALSGVTLLGVALAALHARRRRGQILERGGAGAPLPSRSDEF
jgi:hypothetical protein